MPQLLDYLGVDSLLDALSYMNAVTLGRLACTSLMGAVAAHEAQQRPSLLVLKGTLEKVAQDLRDRLAARPTVVFLQYSVGHHEDEEKFEKEMSDFVAKRLPKSTQVLGGSTMSLQCAWFPEANAKTTMDIRNRYDRCEVAILAATLPEAQAKAFHVVPNAKVDKAGDDSDQESYSESEEEATGGYPGGQKAPVAGELAQLLAMEPAPKVVVIYDADRGSYSSRMMSQIQATFPEAAIIGGVVMGRRVLARNGAVSCGRGVGALAISGNCPLFAMTCPFTGEVERAKQTVQSCMSQAAEIAAGNSESILGALLFTCNARGPHMFGCHAKDASLFQAQFPRAPLMGFYAAGEIGPQVEEGQEHAFLKGNAALQGFTAVFGLFLVPTKRMPSVAFQRAMLQGEVKEAFKDTRT